MDGLGSTMTILRAEAFIVKINTQPTVVPLLQKTESKSGFFSIRIKVLLKKTTKHKSKTSLYLLK